MLNKSMFFLLSMILFYCQSDEKTKTIERPKRHVGDIDHNPKIDNADFTLCNGDENIFQYFNNSKGLEYEGEKIAIDKEFKEKYDASKAKKESGLIRIRFIVNCEGKTDRFRVIGMDKNYHSKNFDNSITDQILSISKGLIGWKPKVLNGQVIDYYQYLIFKIEGGAIIQILP